MLQTDYNIRSQTSPMIIYDAGLSVKYQLQYKLKYQMNNMNSTNQKFHSSTAKVVLGEPVIKFDVRLSRKLTFYSL